MPEESNVVFWCNILPIPLGIVPDQKHKTNRKGSYVEVSVEALERRAQIGANTCLALTCLPRPVAFNNYYQ